MSQESDTPHWMQPWLFCLTHMLKENLIREREDGGLVEMQALVEEMRMYMYNRLYDLDQQMQPNYSLPTFDEWAANPDKRKNRFAQFCWFIASTGGNFRMDCAGSWFPYCALCPDVNQNINSTYGMAPTLAQSGDLVAAFGRLTKTGCLDSVRVQRAHIGRELLVMRDANAMESTTNFYLVGSEGGHIKSSRLKKIYRESKKHPHGGGPLTPIPEDVSMRSFGSVKSGFLNLDHLIHSGPLSTAPPSDFERAAHSEFDNEWYQLRRGRDSPWGPSLPGEAERGFSPVPPPNTPAPGSQAPLNTNPVATPPGSLGPYELEAYVEQDVDPFNYWPYLIFGAVLIGLAIITEDPRDMQI